MSSLADLLTAIQSSTAEIAGDLDAVAAEIASLAARLGSEVVSQDMIDKATAIQASLVAASARLKTMETDPAPAVKPAA